MFSLAQIVATIPKVRPVGVSWETANIVGCETCGDTTRGVSVNCGYCYRWVCSACLAPFRGCCRACRNYIDAWYLIAKELKEKAAAPALPEPPPPPPPLGIPLPEMTMPGFDGVLGGLP